MNDPNVTIANIINGFNCSMMMQAFNNAKQSETATAEQLLEANTQLNMYLDLYSLNYNSTNKTNDYLQ